MAQIRSNAARQAAGDTIRTSPIYKDLMDKLANDPDYDPTSEPLPPADPPAPARGASRNRNAALALGPTTVASAPANTQPPTKKPRAKPKQKPVPASKPELEVVADDETDSNLALLNAESDKVGADEGLDYTSAQGGKGGKGAVGGKGKAVAEGEHAPAATGKGKAVAKGEHVQAGKGAVAKKAQSKKAATTVDKAPATKPSTRAKKS